MTISNELIRVDLVGDGVATAFTFNFRVMAKADLQVYVAGVLKTLVTDYDIVGVDNPAGGTVTFVVAPANLAPVTLIRHMDLHQLLDYTVGEKFPAEAHERAIDRATLQKQQVDEEVKRSVRLGLFASPGTTDTVITDTPAARADRFIGFSADGLAVVPRGNANQLEDLGAAVADADASAAAAAVSEQNAAASSTAAAGFAADADASAVEAAASAAEAATELPQNSQSTDYTAVLEDAGGHIFHPVSDDNPRTFTIPANSSVAFPLGTTLTFVNRINVVTIAITTDTLILAGTGATGSRTLEADGMATAIKIAPTVWMIGGSGLDTGALAVADGGTGATTAAGARSNLGVPSTSEAILDTIMDAKGDLIVATAADTVARRAVGANNQVLTADSAQADGVKWAAIPKAQVASALGSTDQTTTSTTFVDVTGLTVTMTITAGSNVVLTCHLPMKVSASQGALALNRDGVDSPQLAVTDSTTDVGMAITGAFLAETGGSHTYKVRVKAVSAATVSILMATVANARFTAVEHPA